MEDIKKEIIAANKKMLQLFNDGNLDEHCEIYDDDIRMIPPGGKVFLGKEAVKELIKSANRSDIAETVFTVDQVIPLHDGVACVLGRGHNNKIDGTIDTSLKVVNVWKKIDGEWKIHVNYALAVPN